MASQTVSTIAKTAGAAAGTAVMPGIGTAIGSAVGGIVAGLFSGGSGTYANAGPGVHQWATNYAPSAFIDWLKANPNMSGAFASIPDMQKAMVAWLWQPGLFPEGGIVTPGGVGNNTPGASHWYSASVTPAAYAAIGVDYPATLAAITDPTKGAPYANRGRAVMLPAGGTPQIPAAAVDKMQGAVDAARSGGPVSASDRQALSGLVPGGTVNTASFGMIGGVLLLLLLLPKLLK